MPALKAPAVPPLYQTVPDADRLGDHLSLTSQTPFRWVFAPGEEIAVTAAATADLKTDRVVLTVWNWERLPVAQHEMRVPCEEAVAFTVHGRGTYLITLDSFSGDECVARLVRSFSVCPSNLDRRKLWRTDEFFLGTCSFPGRQHWTNEFGPAHPHGLSEQACREMDAELSARLGLQVVRPDVSVRWPSIDAPMDFTRADASMDCWTSRGFKLDLQVGQPSDWAVLDRYAQVTDPKWRYPKREEAVRRFVSECAKRYAAATEIFEVYNEPDNRDFWRGTPEEYIELARWAAQEIRRACPGAVIANGGYTLIEPEWTGLFARAFRPLVDTVAYHSHGDVTGLDRVYRAMVAVHAAADYTKPVFVNTEMGYAAWRLDVERGMAATAIQKALYCWAHGHRGALLYCSRDIGGPRQRPGNPDWGYLDYFMCPRFMYGAVAALIDTYAGASLDGIVCQSSQLHCYVFARGDERLAAVFTPGDASHKVTLASDAARARIVDPMGNSVAAEDPQSLTLTTGYYPQTVVFEGAQSVTVQDTQ